MHAANLAILQKLYRVLNQENNVIVQPQEHFKLWVGSGNNDLLVK
jgi:hypothetical protein